MKRLLFLIAFLPSIVFAGSVTVTGGGSGSLNINGATGGGGGGTGDVTQAGNNNMTGTNSYSGPMVINSTRTTFTPVGNFGVTITSSAATTSAAFMFDVSQSTSNGLVVFDNSTKNQGGGDLLTLISTNTNNHSFNMRMYRNSPGNSNGDIRVDSPNPNFEFIDTTQDGGTSGWGKYEMPSINNDHCNITGRNAANDSFQNIAGFNRIEGANGGGLVLYSTCSIKFSNTVGSYVGFRPGNTFTDAGSIIWTLPLTFNNTGQVMTQISNQPNYQLAFSTGGAAGQFMAWNGSGGPVWATPPTSGGGGGGGSSTLAVGTGTASNFTTQVTSPTASLSFLGSQFSSLALGTTNVIQLNPLLSVSTIQVVESDTGAQYAASGSANAAASGVRINTNDTVEILSRGNSALKVNAVPQVLAMNVGTACLPSYSFGADAGTGMSLPSSDNLQFSAGCSTGIIVHQHDFPKPKDNTIANIFSVFGGSVTTAGDSNSRVDFGIFTATITSTSAQIAQVNQFGALIIVEGHDIGLTNGYTDLLLSSFYLPTPTIIASHDDIGSPPARTYTSGGNSTGILNCSVASGTYYTQAWETQMAGK